MTGNGKDPANFLSSTAESSNLFGLTKAWQRDDPVDELSQNWKVVPKTSALTLEPAIYLAGDRL